MEITEATKAVFYVSKILALAPFSVHKNSKGVLEIKRSVLFSVYAFSVWLILVLLTYRGLLFDANSQAPVRASFRMKSATSKVVTALDVSVVVLAATAGVFCGLFGLKATKELNSRLKKVDDSLHSCSNFKRDRILAIVMLAVPLVSISSLLALDIGTWLRFAVHVLQNNNKDTEMNVQWYIPFYTLYFILTGLHIGFANTAFGLGRRFRRLNLLLLSTFLTDSRKEPTSKQHITTVKVLTQPTQALHASLAKLATESLPKDTGGKNKVMLLKLLAEHHESLVKCVGLVSSSYGAAVLFILVSCLLHLVATAYFLFLELFNTMDDGYVWLQVLWIIFHTFRLLLVVEPCHLATMESKKTIQIICEIERTIHEPIMVEEIKKFWQQLLVVDCEFSASGLCRVNRKILTSVSSAIATYLVILIQFQKTNG